MFDNYFLKLAGVPSGLLSSAKESLSKARKRSRFLTFKKFYVRLFKAKWISEQLSWESNRLIEIHPDKLHWDIAPVKNVTSHGDNGDWVETPLGGRPVENCWLNPDPNSEEYKDAVSKCYWSKGNHPRSKKAVKDWYLRNGGEGLAYALGEPVDQVEQLKIWRGEKGRLQTVALKSGNAWMLQAYIKIFGNLKLYARYGFEVDNVYCGRYSLQMWFPLEEGAELKAPVTNPPWLFSTKEGPPDRKPFPGVEQN